MLSGGSAYIKHSDPVQIASSLFLSICVNQENRIHHRSSQSINLNHNRGTELLFRHGAIILLLLYLLCSWLWIVLKDVQESLNAVGIRGLMIVFYVISNSPRITDEKQNQKVKISAEREKEPPRRIFPSIICCCGVCQFILWLQ